MKYNLFLFILNLVIIRVLGYNQPNNLDFHSVTLFNRICICLKFILQLEVSLDINALNFTSYNQSL